MSFKINDNDWHKYRLWVVAIRIILMGIPALLTSLLEWSFDKSESLLLFLDRKLPDPRKEVDHNEEN
jgi:hypothetical protein